MSDDHVPMPSPTSAPEGITPGFTIRIVWADEDLDPLDVTAGELDAVAHRIRQEDLVVEELLTDHRVPGEVLTAIAVFASADAEDWVTLNGCPLDARPAIGGAWAYVPENPDDLDAVEVASASAAWLPGGPCEFSQRETIYRVDGYYWVRTRGDMDNGTTVIGDLGSEQASVAAAVEASAYFSFDDDGRIGSSLDDIPDPYDDDLPWETGAGRLPTALMVDAAVNVYDQQRLADAVERLIPEESGFRRRTTSLAADDAIAGPEGEMWPTTSPAAMLELAVRFLPQVAGIDVSTWQPVVRLQEVEGWVGVHDIRMTIDGLEPETVTALSVGDDPASSPLATHLAALDGVGLLRITSHSV
ncbi:hypothetical protein [Rhabdothermincola salaria]|uniref:hypothetical protein n=1 Tax=Rhabdothermincola salaria TaxID=2903142 RepID=UPI001E37EEC8|nr:hypothetical protein [Rhabdothermincola salaria]MCD9624229.1 hypothetical protein [Rhabdothermincola salaria]